MAVSGRKVSDSIDSVSAGSAKDFEHSCVPCLSDGQHVGARGFCVDCHEYLCKTCLHCHKKTKASKHHQLTDIDKIDEHLTIDQTTDVCTEKCPTHRNETIKFFCPTHEDLGCTDCMTMKHKACDIDYIPDKCIGIADSEECNNILKKLEQQNMDADIVMNETTGRKIETDSWHNEVIKDIVKFRTDINDHLDIIQKKIETDAGEKNSVNNQGIQVVLDSRKTVISDVKQLHSLITAYKAERRNCALFIAIKRTKLRLQSDEFKTMETVLNKTTHLQFECNKALKKILSIENFGELTEYSRNRAATYNTSTLPSGPNIVSGIKTVENHLAFTDNINIATKSDKQQCSITGSAILTSNKLVLVDNTNGKIKIVDILMKDVVEEKQVNLSPFDVTVIPDSQIAVTIPNKMEILIMKTAGQLSTVRTIKVQGRCRGVTYHQDILYVICGSPNSLLSLAFQGSAKRMFSLADSSHFESPHYITLSQDKTLLYVSDHRTNSVIGIQLDGKISNVYNDLKQPLGLQTLDDGSVLMCCRDNNIYRLQTDLKQSYKVGTGLDKPRTIFYSADQNEVYVGSYECNDLKIFSLQ